MKHRVLPLLFTLVTAFAAYGQNPDGPGISPSRLQEIKAQKVAFITQYLHLTPDESKVFWPIYDQYEGQLQTLRADARKQRRSAAQNVDSLTDAQAQAQLDRQLKSEQQELDINKERLLKIRDAVGARKALLLVRAEREFTRQLFRNIRKDDHGPRGGGQ